MGNYTAHLRRDIRARGEVWNSSDLQWEAMRQPFIETDTLVVTGAMDLTKIGGSAVGLDNSLPVQPGTDAIFPVSGVFWQGTQPVSAESLPLPAGSATAEKQLGDNHNVTVSNLPATQPVSIASMPTTPVTGTFFQETQPVSGAFYQATQPVSGPLTDAELRLSDVKVSLDGEKVVIDSQQDFDMSATYLVGKVQTMSIVGQGKTKSMTFGWTGDDLTSIATTIT